MKTYLSKEDVEKILMGKKVRTKISIISWVSPVPIEVGKVGIIKRGLFKHKSFYAQAITTEAGKVYLTGDTPEEAIKELGNYLEHM